jgi:hypothetical protein
MMMSRSWTVAALRDFTALWRATRNPSSAVEARFWVRRRVKPLLSSISVVLGRENA